MCCNIFIKSQICCKMLFNIISLYWFYRWKYRLSFDFHSNHLLGWTSAGRVASFILSSGHLCIPSVCVDVVWSPGGFQYSSLLNPSVCHMCVFYQLWLIFSPFVSYDHTLFSCLLPDNGRLTGLMDCLVLEVKHVHARTCRHTHTVS